MTGKERVAAALQHREADRVPIWEIGFHNKVASLWLGRPLLLATGGGGTVRFVLEANAKGRAARQEMIARIVDDTLDFYGQVGYDLVRIRPTDFLTPVAFGSGNWPPNALLDATIEEIAPDTWRLRHCLGFWSAHKYSAVSETLADVDDYIKQGGLAGLERYVAALETRPVDLASPPLEDALAGVRRAVLHPAARDIFVLGWADVCYPGASAHIATFLEAMVLAPDVVRRYMEVTTEAVLALVRAQARLGVDGFTGGNDWAFKSGPMFSVRHLRNFIAPYLQRIVAEVHRFGLPYIKHIDGDIRKHLPVLIDEVGIDGLHAIEPGAHMDIFALKRQYGERLTLLGNLDCDLLSRGEPAEIDAAVWKLMTGVAPGGGYIFSTANSVMMDVPLENLEAMLGAARRYGRYPMGEPSGLPDLGGWL